MRRIDEYFHPAVNRTLYHYSSIEGLLGIVKSRSVWASHAYYLNDSAEILHARNVLARIAGDKVPAAKGSHREFLTQFISWLETFTNLPYHIFIFSLSEERSLLSQWRSYTPHGKGVSVGFSAECVNSMLALADLRIAECIYTLEEHRDLLMHLLDDMLITFEQRLPTLNTSKQHPSQSFHGFFEEFRGQFLRVFLIVKHPAFLEEREWRLISPYFPNYTVPEIKYRGGASMLVPYIEMKLPDPLGGPWFKEVLLGPSEDQNLSMNALGCFLSQSKACHVTVNSVIPYRKWAAKG